MANKRDLKKDINYVLGDIIEAVYVWEIANGKKPTKESESIIDDAIALIKSNKKFVTIFFGFDNTIALDNEGYFYYCSNEPASPGNGKNKADQLGLCYRGDRNETERVNIYEEVKILMNNQK